MCTLGDTVTSFSTFTCIVKSRYVDSLVRVFNWTSVLI